MQKTSKKLHLAKQNIRTLSTEEARAVAGGMRRACCDLDTELLNPFTGGGGGGGGACCDLNTQLLNPFTA